jgi:hypothetical protein
LTTPAALDLPSISVAGDLIREHPQMGCDNLAAALHKADTWAKRDREVYTVHRDDTLVATATSKHTTMQAA